MFDTAMSQIEKQKSKPKLPGSSEEQFYKDWLELLRQAVQIATARIAVLQDGIMERQGRCPVEHCKWRINSAASMQEKLRRNHLPPTLEMARTRVYDGAGVRVVCPFINDVYLLVQELRQQPDFEVFKEKDYILHPKENGFRSYHLIIQVNLELQQVPVEIQLRTIAMDCWASLEHQLRYKKHLPESAALSAELKRCADEMASTDLSMQAIQEILDLRSGACMEASLPDKEVFYATLNR